MQNPINGILNSITTKTSREVLIIEAVERQSSEASELMFNAILLHQYKNVLNVNDKLLYGDLEQLKTLCSSKLKKGLPVLLVINSSKILYKHVPVPVSNAATNEQIINEHFSSINVDEFYYQLNTFGNTLFLSVTRKSYIESILQSVHFLKDYCINISLGPFTILKYHNVMYTPENDEIYHIYIRNFLFKIKNGQLIDYKNSSDEYNLSDVVKFSNIDQQISPELQIIYAQGIDYFINLNKLSGINHEGSQQKNDDFFFRKHSNIIIVFSAALLLLFLMISSLIFTVYYGKLSALEKLNSVYQVQLELNDKYDKEAKEKIDILYQNGFFQKQKITQVTDKIISTLPANIYLRKLTIYPEKKKALKGDALFDAELITVRGNCYTASELQTWITLLKNINWVNDVTIREYKHIDEEYLYDFVIDIRKRKT